MTAIMRTPLVLPVAATVTVGLFVMMRGMIDIGPVDPVQAVDPPRVEIRFEVEDRGPVDPVTPDDITRVDPPPPPVRIETDTIAPSEEPGIAMSTLPPVSGGEIEISHTGPVSPDGSPTPVVRVEPVYPAIAASRGLEGQCTIIFDITPQGLTANVRIMSCSNRAFQQASVNAVRRWRYTPQISAGETVMFRGATTQLVYRLD